MDPITRQPDPITSLADTHCDCFEIMQEEDYMTFTTLIFITCPGQGTQTIRAPLTPRAEDTVLEVLAGSVFPFACQRIITTFILLKLCLHFCLAWVHRETRILASTPIQGRVMGFDQGSGAARTTQ